MSHSGVKQVKFDYSNARIEMVGLSESTTYAFFHQVLSSRSQEPFFRLPNLDTTPITQPWTDKQTRNRVDMVITTNTNIFINAKMSTSTKSPSRSPMKSLNAHENIPLSQPRKFVQLGMELFAKKRERENLEIIPNPPPKKAKLNDAVSDLDKFELSRCTTREFTEQEFARCHHCRKYIHQGHGARCTLLRKTKSQAVERCPFWYCEQCYKSHYNEPLLFALSKMTWIEGHDKDEEYTWICPHCRGSCICKAGQKKFELAKELYLLWGSN